MPKYRGSITKFVAVDTIELTVTARSVEEAVEKVKKKAEEINERTDRGRYYAEFSWLDEEPIEED